jgi:hypothetical protein
MVGDDNSKMEEIAVDLYKDKDRGANSMDLDINQVHQDTDKLLQEQSIAPEDGAGSASKKLQTSLTRQSGSNKGSSLSANGSRSVSLGHPGNLLTDLAKTSLCTNEVMPEQG